MGFLSPLLLLGLAALAIPVVLHLMKRREGRTVVFPALRYLTRTTREHARIIRLRQILLLALRMAAILLLVLAGARLVLPLGGADAPPAGLALVVDNGLSSGAVIGEGRVLDSLVARGEAALERAGPRDRIWVIPAGEPWRAVVPLSPEEAGRALAELAPTHVTPDLSAALGRARSLLEAGGPEPREILLLSDLRPESFPAPPPEAVAFETPVRVAPPPPIPAPNRGVGEIQVSGGLAPRVGDPSELQVQLEGEGVAGVTVRVYLDDEFRGAARTGPDGSAIFPLPPFPEGWVHGRVEAPPDDLRGDDVGYFAFPVLPPPSVRIGASSSPFLIDALEVLADAGRIRLMEGDGAQVQFAGDASPGELGAATTVVLIPPDEPALLPSANRVLNELLPGWRLEAEPEETEGLRYVEGGALGSVAQARIEVRRAYRIVPSDAGSEPVALLNLSDGSTWLAEARSDGRRILILGSPLAPEASDLPTSAAMLPLIDRLTTPAGASLFEGELPAGTPLTPPEEAAAIRLPDGTRRTPEGMSAFVETGRAGIVQVLGPDDQILRLYAINSRTPSSTGSLTPEGLVARLGPAWARVSVEDPWPGALLADRRGREVWRPLLVALLLVLLAEGWLASSGAARSRPSRIRGEPRQEPKHTMASRTRAP